MRKLINRIRSVSRGDDSRQPVNAINGGDEIDLSIRHQLLSLASVDRVHTVFSEKIATTLSHGVPSLGCHCMRLDSALAKCPAR